MSKAGKCRFCDYEATNYGYDCNRMYAYNCCDDPECIKKWNKEYIVNEGSKIFKKGEGK